MNIEKVNQMIHMGDVDFTSDIEDILFAKSKMSKNPPVDYLEFWDFENTQSLTGTQGNTIVLGGDGVGLGVNGLIFSTGNSVAKIPAALCGKGKYYEIVFHNFEREFSSGFRFIFSTSADNVDFNEGFGFHRNLNRYAFYGTNGVEEISALWQADLFKDSTLRIEVLSNGKVRILKNETLLYTSTGTINPNHLYYALGSALSHTDGFYNMQVASLKVGDLLE